jgi:hypothetical protein
MSKPFAGIVSGARLAGVGREADLIVRNDVQRATGAVAAQPRQVQGFWHHALTGERSVTMDNDGDHEIRVLRHLRSGAIALFRPRHSLDNGVHEFEVARVRCQRDGERLAAGRGVRAFSAEVVLHVAGACSVGVNALELLDDRAVRHAEHVRQHVETAAVCHTDSDLSGAGRGSALDG